MKRKPTGWRNEPYRHSLASHGVHTNYIKSDGILYVPRKSKDIPHVTEIANQRIKYLIGRIVETRDFVKSGEFDEETLQTIIRYLIDEIRDSSLYMSVVARDEEKRKDLENVVNALDEYGETGLLHHEIPSISIIDDHMIALQYVFGEAMGVYW